MTQTITAPKADASLTRGIYPPLDVSPFARSIAGTPGLVHYVDPESLPDLTNATPVPLVADRTNGRPIIASAPLVPILATEGGVANSRTLFDVTAITDCNLTALDPTVTPSFTFITLWRPLGHAIDGTVAAYLLRSLDAGIGKAGLLSNVGTPTLLFRDEAGAWGVTLPLAGHVSLSVPLVLAVSLDQASRRAAIYINDGSVAAASTIASSIPSYPASSQWTFFGSKVGTVGGLSRFGRTLIYNRALADGAGSELASLITQFKSYYGVS